MNSASKVIYMNGDAAAYKRPRRPSRPSHVSHADITAPSLSSSLVDPSRYPTPIARDVAILRARASLADSERRRYKEERTWALAQGNKARADEMSWQAERYHAIMKAFHEQADRMLVEGEIFNWCNELSLILILPF